MIHLIKVLLFVIVNVAGYYTIPVMINVTIKAGLFPQMPTIQEVEVLKFWLLSIGSWIWLGAAVASIGYFFAAEKVRVWLILAPLYMPFFWGTGVLIYFTWFYTPLG